MYSAPSPSGSRHRRHALGGRTRLPASERPPWGLRWPRGGFAPRRARGLTDSGVGPRPVGERSSASGAVSRVLSGVRGGRPGPGLGGGTAGSQIATSTSASGSVAGANVHDVPGVLLIQGMSLRIPEGSLVLSVGEDGKPGSPALVPHLRLDLWPTWLEIGCEHSRRAHETASALGPDLDDQDKADLLGRELQDAIVAMCAFAFAFDGFYDVVKSELGDHPDAALWREGNRRPTPRHRQVAETLRFHLKLGPKFTRQLKRLLQELFKFRGRAVHPSSSYLPAIMREDIDSGVHPHLITFSGWHAVQCRSLVLVLLDQLVDRAAEVAAPSADRGWIETGRREVDRLAAAYRIPGDDPLAHPVDESHDDEVNTGQDKNPV